MAEPRSFTLTTAAGTALEGLLNLPPGGGPVPAIVAAHGFKGFMEWGFFPYFADLLSDRGFAVVRFNFSSAGMRPGDELVTDREAFRRGTVGDNVAELSAVLAAVAGGRIAPGAIDPDRVSLFGHSRGGGAALLAAAQPEWRDRIRALVTWASVGTFDRLNDEQIADWRRRGELEILNVRTGQRLMLGLEILEDLEANRAERDLEAAAALRTAPWLIVHGERDETVPHAEAEALDRAAGGRHRLLIIPGGDHGLGGRHPFPGPRPELIQALNATQRWYRQPGGDSDQ